MMGYERVVKRSYTTLPTLIGIMMLDTAAGAQNIESSTPSIGSMFARDRTVTVTERVISGYSRQGVRVGAVIVRPEISAGVLLNDNLYATENNRVADAALTISPSVSAQLSGNTTTFNVVADAQVNRYFSRDSENTSTYGVQGRGRHELGSGFWVSATGVYRHQIERRSDPGAINISIRPIEYDLLDARGELGWEQGRVRVSGYAGGGLLRFQDGALADGTVLVQDFRDRKTARANVQGDYALSANMALRIQANFARSSYDSITSIDQLDRSSNRYELLGGATFEFSDLLRGEVGLGYINQKYDSPVFTAFSGFGGRVQIEYLPTQLTTLTLRASRTIEGNDAGPR